MNRAGGRRQRQPDRQSGERLGALVIARLHPRGRDDSGQKLYGARTAEPAPANRAFIRNSECAGVCGVGLSVDDGTWQRHQRQTGRGGFSQDAAFAGGGNAMILSLLYKARAEQVRMILIDPKMLELSVYNGVPHLLCPVVTDMRQA